MPNTKAETALQLRKMADEIEREFIKEAERKFIENLPNYLETAVVYLMASGENPRFLQLIVDKKSDFANDFNQLFGSGYPGFTVKIGDYEIWAHNELGRLLIRVTGEPGLNLDLYDDIVPFAKKFLPNINIYHLEKRWNKTKDKIKELERDRDFILTTLKSFSDTYS